MKARIKTIEKMLSLPGVFMDFAGSIVNKNSESGAYFIPSGSVLAGSVVDIVPSSAADWLFFCDNYLIEHWMIDEFYPNS